MIRKRNNRTFIKVLAALITTGTILSSFPRVAIATNKTGDMPVPEALKSNVMCFLPFEDDFNDLTGNIDVVYDDKTSVGGNPITIGDGKDGNSAIFNGSGSIQNKGKNSSLNLGNIDYGVGEDAMSFSFGFWVKSTNTSPDPVLVGNKDWYSGGNLGYCISDTKGNMVLNYTTQGTARIDATVPNFTKNQWQYVVVTADRAEGLYSIYIDGALMQQTSRKDTIGKSINTNYPTRIGADGAEQYGFVGSMDSFVMFDKVLNNTEVKDLATANGVDFSAVPMTYSTSTSVEKDSIAPGEVVSVTLNVDNETDFAKSKLSARLLIDGDAEIIGEPVQTASNIEPGQGLEMTWQVKGNSGGTRFYVEITEDKKQSYEINAGGVTVSGEGWFTGDNHTHSKYSDGGGTIGQNFDANRKRGVNYISITDHSNSLGWLDAQKNESDNMIAIRGNEYSSSRGHAVVMNVNENKNYSNMTKQDMVNHVKEVTNGRALVYAAHPYENYAQWDGDDWYVGIDGIEVWNGWWGARQKYNVAAFEQWDRLNNEGLHIYGIATTDAHSTIDMGKTFTSTYVKEWSADGIIDAHFEGHMYGSNGPEIEFNIKDAMMGDDLGVSESGETVEVSMKGSYHKDLSKVYLIKNGEVIHTEALSENTFNISKAVDVKPGDFLRMEVEGFEEEGLTLDSPTFDAAPFAFSNPIFIVDNASENKVVTEDIKNIEGYKGTEINVPVTVSNLPLIEGARSAEIVVNVPEDLDVKNVELNSSVIKNATCDYNEKDGELRIAVTNTTGEELSFDEVEENSKIADITFVLKEDKNGGDSTNVSIAELIFRCNENEDVAYDTTNATINMGFAEKEVRAAFPRVLYRSEENDAIPEEAMAVAVEFTGVSDDLNISFDEDIDMYYNPDFTKVNGKTTYIALVSKETSLEQLSDISNYTFKTSEEVSTVTFGDYNNDGIDAQDALMAVFTWLRKTEVEKKGALSINVSGDGKINTRDSIEIVDKFVFNKDFTILSK